MATVCSMDYIGKTYNQKDAPYIAAMHIKAEEVLTTLGKGIVKKGVGGAQYFRPKSYSTETYNKLVKIANRINDVFGGKVIHIKKDSGPKNRNYIIVNVNDAAKKNLFYIRDSAMLQDSQNFTNVDGEIENDADLDSLGYEHRVNNLTQQDNLSLNSLVEQAVEMENKFKEAGISVVVTLDGDLNSSGALLGKDSTKRKEMIASGAIGEDTYIISINPKKMAGDTLMHEFGHIYIDLIGGSQNARIQAAYRKLQGTQLYNEVKELYPELTPDSDVFIKEVVNRALGQNASKTFNQNKDNQNWWKRFTDWLYENIGKMFNVQKDVISDLTKDFLSVDKQSFTQNNVSDDTYFHKVDNSVKSTEEQISNTINSIDDANEVLFSSINKLVEDVERIMGQKLTDTSVSKTKEHSEERKILALKKLSENFETIKKGEETKFLLDFASEIDATADNFLGYLRGALDKIDTDYDTDQRTNTISLIVKYQNFFTIAEDILSDINYMGLKGEKKELVRNALSKAANKRNDIMRDLVDLMVDLMIKTQSANFHKIYTEYKNRYEIEYNQTKDDAVSEVLAGESKKAFVDRMLAENHDQIIKETQDYLRLQLRESLDIGSIEKLLRSEKDINSTMITIMSQLFDKADFDTTKNFIPYRTKAQPVFMEYKAKFGSNDMKKMYGDLIHETENSAYLIGEYLPEFYDTVVKNIEEIKILESKRDDEVNQDKKKEIGKEIRELKKKHRKWYNENTKEYQINQISKARVPIDKWKDPKYAKIKANPDSAEAKMLAFLEEIHDKAEENTKGLKTLNRSIDGLMTTFRRLPAVERDSLERLYGGDYAENAQDIFERLFRRAPDEEEIGEAFDDEGTPINKYDNVKITRGNFNGDERYLVPIHFRHKFDKKTNSFDLLTAYMMNLYMSENFKNKSAIQPLAEIMIEVSKQKRYIKPKDLKHLAAAHHISLDKIKALRTENSNEFEKLRSMAENRLYGIKTIDNQFGKIAENIMAWTGTTMLALNFYSGISNLVQGKVMNFIEGVGGEFFNRKELLLGESKFFKDMGAWINDIGEHSPESRTMRLLDIIDPAGDFKGVSQRYIRSNKMKGLVTRSSLSFPNRMGEMYVQSTLMYSILSKIKVQDKDNNFLDRNMRPTKDESKAMSLDDVIELNEDGTFSLPDVVHSTSFSYTANGDHDKIILETKNLIKKVTSDLHGQYDTELQSHAQRTIIGKAFFMLRKWIQPGIDRRFRGAVHAVGDKWMDFDQIDNADYRNKRFYSEDTKSFREGTYTTMLRFTRQLLKEGDLAKIFIAGKTKAWNKMTDHEKANIRKWVTEFATITLSLISAWILKGLGEDLPEEEAQAVFLAAYTFRRLHQELVAYANPVEALQLMRSPMASISLIENSLQLIGATLNDGKNVLLGDPLETYQTGRRKGQLKIAKEFNDILPILSQTNRNLEDVKDYVFKTY